MPESSKVIVLIIGQPGSGKTTACKYLARRFNFTVIRISDLIREYSESNNIQLSTRQDYIDAHALMLREQGRYSIVRRLLATPGQRLCVDGIRVPAHIAKLQQKGAKVIALHCLLKTRFARTKARQAPLDRATLADFRREEEEETKNQDPFFQNTSRALAMADCQIDASLNVNDVRKRLDEILEQLSIR